MIGAVQLLFTLESIRLAQEQRKEEAVKHEERKVKQQQKYELENAIHESRLTDVRH